MTTGNASDIKKLMDDLLEDRPHGSYAVKDGGSRPTQESDACRIEEVRPLEMRPVLHLPYFQRLRLRHQLCRPRRRLEEHFGIVRRNDD